MSLKVYFNLLDEMITTCWVCALSSYNGLVLPNGCPISTRTYLFKFNSNDRISHETSRDPDIRSLEFLSQTPAF